MFIAQAAGEYGGAAGVLDGLQSWMERLGEMIAGFSTKEYVIIGVVVVAAFVLLGRRR
jgi:type IV secretory pathway VirB2 component (pilin)